jgi:broad specificity phosphatase PhoE
MIYYHSQTPGDLEATLACGELLTCGKLLLMRHSVRPPFPPENFYFQVDLTSEGVRLAEGLGTRLGTQLISLDSSTSSRCIQTAEAISRGSGQPVSVRANPKLGDKGVFVQDSDRNHQYMVEQGPLGLVNAGLRGASDCGLNSVRASTQELLQNLWKEDLPDGTCRVAVTHDTILSLILGVLSGYQELSEADWPKMLEGALLWEEEDRLCWCWRGDLYSQPRQEWLG